MKNRAIEIILLAFVALSGPSHVRASKILSVYSTPSKSHLIFAQNLLIELAKRGHEVTVVSPFPLDKPQSNYRDVVVDIPLDLKATMEKMVTNPPTGLQFLSKANEFQNQVLQFVNSSIHHVEMQKMMAEEQFDLVILPFFLNEMQTGLAAHFKCPLIVVASVGDTSMVTSLVGNPSAVATSSSLWLGYHPPMTFWQRVKNFAVTMMEGLMIRILRWKSEEYYNFNFPPEKYPPFSEMITKVDLLLANHHFSEGNVRPTVPSLIDVGGLQTKETPDPLPANIQKWIDGAEHGVILFSLGSNVKSSSLSLDKLQVILKVFGTLKQRVLFKWETDKLLGSPDNVLALKWMPQDDILAHKNVKLFITHGGKGSIVESKFHGVPVIGIPFFADQSMNVAGVVEDGWGLQLDFAEMTEDKLRTAVIEILTDPKYRTRVQHLSALYRDRPMSALETSIFWVEYVMRHKGAPHMRYPALDMNIFQSNSLDVVALLMAVLYVAIKVGFYVTKRCFCWILSKCGFGSSQSSKKSNKKLKKTKKHKKKSIQAWLDDAKDGVILFSLGSNVKSSSLPNEKLRIFLDTFAKIKQRVIWKWEAGELPLKLDNVMTSKWLPQDDILAHKNVKLFITHGGKGGLSECMFHGVPILGIPFFGDQMVNIDAAVTEGWALRVDFASLTPENFHSALQELTQNSKFSQVIKGISTLYKDRPMTALETATYWTEYVIRHRGAPHMRYPGVDLNVFQRNSLDVVGLLALVTYLGFKFSMFALKLMCRCVCFRSEKTKFKKP